MGKAERKRLKQEGKRLVEQKSQEIREALERANPVPISDPQWAANYKEQTLRERELRKDTPNRIDRRTVEADWEVIVVEEDFQPGQPRAAAQFLRCPTCGDLIHIRPTESIACGCGAIGLDLNTKALCAPQGIQIPLVKLIGSAPKSKGLLGRLFTKRPA
nr:putative integron gene cassette protein [uncultured bacterium]